MAKIIELSNLNDRGLKFHYHITRTALMFYLIKKTFDLMAFYERENEIEYVNVIRARTDFVQGGYYPVVDWTRDYEDAIYVGAWNWSGTGKYRMNDHFAISSRSNMKKYCDFYDQMYVVAQKFANNEMGSKISASRTKVWSPEHMLSIHLTEAGIKWRNAR